MKIAKTTTRQPQKHVTSKPAPSIKTYSSQRLQAVPRQYSKYTPIPVGKNNSHLLPSEEPADHYDTDDFSYYKGFLNGGFSAHEQQDDEQQEDEQQDEQCDNEEKVRG